MITVESLRADVERRLDDLGTKHHVSLRWEPAPGIARVGVAIDQYTWDNRSLVIDRLLEFEAGYDGLVALEFDVIPLSDLNTADFATV